MASSPAKKSGGYASLSSAEDDGLAPPSPEIRAGLWDRITFSWISPVIKLGSKKPLDLDDLYGLRETDTSKAISIKFAKAWAAEKERRPDNPVVFRAMYHTFGVPWLVAGLFKLVHDVLAFAGPFFLSGLLDFLVLAQEEETSFFDGIRYSVAMFCAAQVQSIFLHQYFHRVFRVGMHARSSVITAVYSKSLRLSNGARQADSVGQMVNLMAVDAQRLNSLLPYLHNIWSSPFQILVSLTMLQGEIGLVPTLAGLFIMLCVMPLNGKIARFQQKNQRRVMEARDERVKIFNEVLNGVKIIKLYAWEEGFKAKIETIRVKEMRLLKRYRVYGVASRLMWSAVPVLVSVTSFSVFTLLGNELTPSKAFVSLSLFNILRFPLAVLPSIIAQAVEAKVSIGRIQKFLNSPEIDAQAVLRDSYPAASGQFALEMPSCTMFWDDDMKVPAISDVSMQLKPRSLTLIIGKTGSGKSALLQGMSGELKVGQRQGLVVKGRTSYAAQVPWIQNCTIEDNIRFGLPMDRAYYDLTLDACCLRTDLEILEGGDQTEIGEKGINLSGGQKARVALARAVYAKPDVCLLDDPLSAVDNHVGAALTTDCIMGLLKDCCVVLATHRYSSTLLNAADQIFMMEDGRIAARGTYKDLMAQGVTLGEADDNTEDKVADKGSENTESSEDATTASSAASSTTASSATESPRTDATKTGEKKNSKLTTAESREVGAVAANVYATYLKAFGGASAVAGLVLGYVFLQGLDIGTNRWLAFWSTQAALSDDAISAINYLEVYAMLSFMTILWKPVLLVFFAFGGLRAAIVQHRDLLHSVLRAPMSWFDTTPVGRVLNRFSGDINIIDERIPDIMNSFLDCAFQVVAVVVVIIIVTPWFAVALGPLYYIYNYTQGYYIRCSRELKRLESMLKSPTLSHFSESLDGLSTIRAYGAQRQFVQDNEAKLDRNVMAYFPSVVANRWLAMRTEFIGTCTVLTSATLVVLARNTLTPGLGGLSVSYAQSISNTFNWMVRMTGERETNVVSVERVKEFSELESEAPLRILETQPSPSWPSSGQIKIQQLELRYRPGLDTVLKGISLEIAAGEKVGIAGRTGAGKSTLVLAMMRIVEPCGGSIVIDGVDISKIGLQDLRSRLGIIPQDPVLFTGSLRFNLDPFDLCSSADIKQAVENSSLADACPDIGMEVTEGGANFSVGQRQLICMARALLRRPKVLLLDEATSAVDQQTDALIQDTIKTNFQQCTMLTIAHRLNTILDSDKILVLEAGRVLEFRSPSELRRDPSSAFARMLTKESHGGDDKGSLDDFLG